MEPPRPDLPTVLEISNLIFLFFFFRVLKGVGAWGERGSKLFAFQFSVLGSPNDEGNGNHAMALSFPGEEGGVGSPYPLPPQ